MIKTSAGETVGTAPPPTGRQFGGLHAVAKKAGVPPSTIKRLVANEEFPRPIRLSPRTCVWDMGEVEAWMAERLAMRGAA
jgi:predicted DNA-binding transcriptional regulator AlpA